MMLSFLKSVIFKNPLNQVPPPAIEAVILNDDEVVIDCVHALACQDGGLGLFRLVHLLDTLQNHCPAPHSIISIGSGKGYHEIILSKLFPDSSVTAIDLQKQDHAHQSANLNSIQGDILDSQFIDQLQKADFVYSIECLEHIQQDSEAFAAMAEMAHPGGTFYIQIPYATDWERNNKEVVDLEYQSFGHCTPGYDAGQLTTLAEKSSLEIQSIQNVFWAPLQPMLWAAVEKFGPDVIHRYTPELISLLMTDFREGLAQHRGQCTGIKMVTTKPGVKAPHTHAS
jgi:SAM-dependent methyltransferase